MANARINRMGFLKNLGFAVASMATRPVAEASDRLRGAPKQPEAFAGNSGPTARKEPRAMTRRTPTA
jgi:hypothetical protein